MTEKEDKIENAPQAHALPGTSEQLASEKAIGEKKWLPNHDHDPSMPAQSKGEKIYNWTVYSGLNYWVNLASSVVIADYFRNLSGKKYLDLAIDKSAKMLTKFVQPAKAEKFAGTSLRTLALMSGGWLLLVPMKLMEDRKRPIVHWINKKMGVDQTAMDGHEKTPDEIYIEKEQPHQTWWNVFKRRIYATVAVTFGAGQLVEHTFGEQRATEKIVGVANKGLSKIPGPVGRFLTQNERMQQYLRFTALDAFYTKVTAMVMHFTNGAKAAKLPKEVGDDKSPAGTDTVPNEIDLVPAAGSSFVQRTEGKARERAPGAIAARGQSDSFTTAVQKGSSPEISLGN